MTTSSARIAPTHPFHLVRESTDRVLEHDFLTKRAALTNLGYSIVDNGHGTKAEAQRFAATIQLGVPATFGPYTFTLTKQK